METCDIIDLQSPGQHPIPQDSSQWSSGIPVQIIDGTMASVDIASINELAMVNSVMCTNEKY